MEVSSKWKRNNRRVTNTHGKLATSQIILKKLKDINDQIYTVQWTSFPLRMRRLHHCWGAAGGSGARLGDGAVVTTTVDTDFGEPDAMCCWSCCACTVWMRTWDDGDRAASTQMFVTWKTSFHLRTIYISFQDKWSHLAWIKAQILWTYLRGLSLLLKLLELLCCYEADRFVSCDELRPGGHGGQDDVPAQTAEAARRIKGEEIGKKKSASTVPSKYRNSRRK